MCTSKPQLRAATTNSKESSLSQSKGHATHTSGKCQPLWPQSLMSLPLPPNKPFSFPNNLTPKATL